MIKLHAKHPKIFVSIILLALASIVYSKLDLITVYARNNAVLSFGERNITIEPGEKYSIPIKLNTMAQNAIGVDVVINYNQNVVKILGVASLKAFDNPVISNIDNENGITTFHLINNEGNYTNVSNKDIFVITILGEKTGDTRLSIKTNAKDGEKKIEGEEKAEDTLVSHITLDNKSDGLGRVNNALVKVRLNNLSNQQESTYGIAKESEQTSGIEPIPNSKVLGATDSKADNSFIKKTLDVMKTPFAIGVSVFALIFTVFAIKIYRSYKSSLDEVMEEEEEEEEEEGERKEEKQES